MKTYKMLIGGKLVGGTDSMPVINPATEDVIANAPDCTRSEMDQAVAAAKKAFPSWSATPIEQRKQVVMAISKAIQDNAAELVPLLTAEQGKPIKGAQEDVIGGAMWLMAGTQLEIPEHVIQDDDERYSFTRHIPLGVVAGIVPWNFPILLAMFKVGPALIAGNTMVLKPSPTTPLTTLRIGELIADLVPPGVLNIISGSDRLGPWLTAHKDVDKVSFTGSTATGKKVMEGAADGLKRLTLELGGNDAAIILPDVDPKKTAESLFWAGFSNSGQICIATKRYYIHDSIYDKVRDEMAAIAASVKVGDGANPDTNLGPIQNEKQYARVKDIIENAKRSGLRFAYEGGIAQGPGFFIQPHIVDNPPDDAEIVQLEQFGPIVPLMKYSDLNDAISRANATNMGLGASVWSANTEAAMDVAEQLEAGNVWINNFLHLHPLGAFAGAKQSGVGSEGGVEGALAYTQTKTFHVLKQHPNAG